MQQNPLYRFLSALLIMSQNTKQTQQTQEEIGYIEIHGQSRHFWGYRPGMSFKLLGVMQDVNSVTKFWTLNAIFI
ncbi:MAG: hypothetical protein HQL94_06520 [Magnetococcales bacterium]|nr:hypothetical protein [Magnetococcales bacterium]MBF0439862.1 hypothetical protein [Magnetococcales bacterium]